MGWRNSEEQMDLGRIEDFCNVDAPEGKTLILENAILHGQAERLQQKHASEANQHPLLTPLCKPEYRVASPAGREPAPVCLVGRCSIHLSDGRVHLFYQRRLRRSRAHSTSPLGTAVGIVTPASPFPDVRDARRR